MLRLAIDFGTSVTKIYRIGSGIVLAEATCVAVSKDTGEIRAFGNEAKRLWGRTAEQTTVRFPVFEGEIASEPLAAALLEYFLKKIGATGRTEALFCIPCGFKSESREKYYRMAESAGIARAYFAETPFLSALGQDVPLSEFNPVFCIDVGAGCTSIAAFSLDGVIAGLSMNVGGNNMDVHIIDHVAERFNLKIGSQMSEKLKNTVASFIEYDNQSAYADGRDLTDGKPRSISVSSSDVAFPVGVYTDKILEYAELVLRKLPAEVSAAICKNGVFLSGGVCKIPGIADYVAKKLQIEAHLAEEPQMAVVLGGGRVIGNPALLRKIAL
ncbi:MAG: rod shape-determining protein [Candidatus Gallimonas sp.]